MVQNPSLITNMKQNTPKSGINKNRGTENKKTI
jgi:hypothetical protein